MLLLLLAATISVVEGEVLTRANRLTSPTAGASWAAGSKHHITWTGPSGAVEVSFDGGRSWQGIEDRTERAGTELALKTGS